MKVTTKSLKISMLAIPILMVSPIGKIVWFLSLVSRKRSAALFFFVSIIIIQILTVFAVSANTFLINYATVLDIAIIFNLLFITSISLTPEKSLDVNLLRNFVFPFMTYVCVSALIGNVYIYNDYGQPRIVLGFGPATASILFAMFTTIFWMDLKINSLSPKLLVSILLLLLSGGRTPIAATALIVIFTILRRRLRRKYALILLIIALGLIASSGFLESILGRSGIASGSDLSEIKTSGRLLVWSAVYNTAEFEYFRVALGQTTEIMLKIRSQIGFSEDQYHSEVLRLYVIFGVSGVIWYTMLIIIFLFRVFTCAEPIASSVILLLLLIGLSDNTLLYLHFWSLIYLLMVRRT